MKTIKQVLISIQRVEVVPEELADNTAYISEKYKTIVHKCLCGCGNLSITPIGHLEPRWKFSTDNGKLTMTPSLLNKNCPNNSHYIITNGVANFV